MTDQPFEPRLGRPRDTSATGSRIVNRIITSTARQGSHSKRSSFTPGALDRRGGGLGARAQNRPPGTRRVTVRARIARHRTPDLGAAHAHLRYIQRDGVTREGERGKLYDRETDDADGGAFLERSQGERHQFRFIVSPEDSHQMHDLKPFVRDLMARMERDLDTSLDWIAVDHFNTDNPHTHIVVRGKTDQDKDLVIARSYISHGMRWRAEQLVTLELGLETELERITGLQRDIHKQRFTRLDRAILGAAKENVLAVNASSNVRDHSAIRQARLRTLERLGLAREHQIGVWVLDTKLETKLRDLGERFDRIKTIERVLEENTLERSPSSFSIFGHSRGQRQIIGRVLGTGPVDELADRRYVVIDGLDGRFHYAEFNAKPKGQTIEREQIVRLSQSEQRYVARSVVSINIASHAPVSELSRYDGPTWLDRVIVSKSPPILHQAGFGKEVEQALARRQQWLIEQGYAHKAKVGELRAKPQLLNRLAGREREHIGALLERQLGAPYRALKTGHSIAGIYERSVTVPDGKLAVISRPDGFTLARWRPELERHLGRHIRGIAGARSVTWQLGRARDLSAGR